MWIILERQADTVCFSGESEMRGIAVKCCQCPSRGHLDGAIEFLGLEQFGPETLGVRADCLDLDPTPTGFCSQDLNRLSPMRAVKDGSLSQVVEEVISGHNVP